MSETEYEIDSDNLHSDTEEEKQLSEDDMEEDESDENADETTDAEENTNEVYNKTKELKNELAALKKQVIQQKKENELRSKKDNDKKMKEAEDFQTKIFTEEVQMANEISNRYVADSLTHNISINENEQRRKFYNWICDSGKETKDIDFEEWQNTHSSREAYFFGPDNVIKCYFFKKTNYD